jgi:ABC-type lipoprotein export system ATPase subunit
VDRGATSGESAATPELAPAVDDRRIVLVTHNLDLAGNGELIIDLKDGKTHA